MLIQDAAQHDNVADADKHVSENQEPQNAPRESDTGGADTARQQRNRKLLSTCTSIEPWLLEQFPLESRDVIISHVRHKTAMLPHFQIRLTSNANHDGKLHDCFEQSFAYT